MEQLPKAQDALAALKKADTPDAAAIAAKEREIQLIKDQTLAREKIVGHSGRERTNRGVGERATRLHGGDPEYKALETWML